MTGGSAPDPRRARAGRIVGTMLFHTVYRGRMRNADRVPQDGPVILVANHAAFLDGPIVFSLAPRPVNFLVKQEAFRGLFGWVLRAVGQIPIDRTIGDRAALTTAVAVLERGGAVGIFPEGTRRDGDVDEVSQGAAWIALRTGAQVVPVAVHGSRVTGRSADVWPRPLSRITVDYGHPFGIAVDEALPGRARLRAASDQVRDALASHVRTSRVENGPSRTITDSRTP